MTLKTHVTTGLSLGFALSGLYANYMVNNISEFGVPVSLDNKYFVFRALCIIIGTVAGAAYPDIDHKDSLLYTNGEETEWEENLGGRGDVVHTIFPNAFGVMIPFLLLEFIANKIGLARLGINLDWLVLLGVAMAVGIVWHLIGGDLFTPEGVMLFYPFSKCRVKIPIVKEYAVERIYRWIVSAALLFLSIKIWDPLL